MLHAATFALILSLFFFTSECFETNEHLSQLNGNAIQFCARLFFMATYLLITKGTSPFRTAINDLRPRQRKIEKYRNQQCNTISDDHLQLFCGSNDKCSIAEWQPDFFSPDLVLGFDASGIIFQFQIIYIACI